MAKPNFRMVTVHQSQQLSPSFQRIWLTGESLADFPADSDGGYIKLLFDADGRAIQTADQLEQLPGRPTMRTYTVRSFDPSTKMMTVDFVRHEHSGHSGPAAQWAMSVQPDETILIGGPGPATRLNPQAEWFLLAADMSALPAMCANLEALPDNAQGVAVIEIAQPEDQLALTKPDGIELRWVVNENPNVANSVLSDALRAVPWREGVVSAWAACEFSNMRLIRQFLKHEKQLDRQSMYVSSYWKMGITEEQHKVVKREDATQNDINN